MAYRNACNEFLLTKITVFELNEFFTPRKLPAILWYVLCVPICTCTHSPTSEIQWNLHKTNTIGERTAF